jgi:hypothetical protein
MLNTLAILEQNSLVCVIYNFQSRRLRKKRDRHKHLQKQNRDYKLSLNGGEPITSVPSICWNKNIANEPLTSFVDNCTKLIIIDDFGCSFAQQLFQPQNWNTFESKYQPF